MSASSPVAPTNHPSLRHPSVRIKRTEPLKRAGREIRLRTLSTCFTFSEETDAEAVVKPTPPHQPAPGAQSRLNSLTFDSHVQFEFFRPCNTISSQSLFQPISNSMNRNLQFRTSSTIPTTLEPTFAFQRHRFWSAPVWLLQH